MRKCGRGSVRPDVQAPFPSRLGSPAAGQAQTPPKRTQKQGCHLVTPQYQIALLQRHKVPLANCRSTPLQAQPVSLPLSSRSSPSRWLPAQRMRRLLYQGWRDQPEPSGRERHSIAASSPRRWLMSFCYRRCDPPQIIIRGSHATGAYSRSGRVSSSATLASLDEFAHQPRPYLLEC